MTLKTLITALTLSVSAIIAGCASGQHIVTSDGTCLTCVNNIITGKPMNYEAEDHPGSTVSASQSNSSHAAFRKEAAALVSKGFPYEKNPSAGGLTDASFEKGIYTGQSSRKTFETSLALKQAFGILSGQDMKARGMSDMEISTAMQDKPFRQDGDVYYMGGTFNGAAGPITSVIVIYPHFENSRMSHVGMKILGYDKKYGDTRAAANAMHTLVLQALNYNDVNWNSLIR
ncbi:hypothetical protein [Zhongshania sp. BJYM1]|uniref:hypothetical protein n=1 Tax=Zhongshania aquatica TaxID=2965069 RepID=UPI0022B4E645|nr:hypothetical protein [Marortus sp. BJYM1]